MKEERLNKAVYQMCRLAAAGFNDWKSLGDIYARRQGDLLLLNYTAKAQISGRWNRVEQVCRGLIIDTRRGTVAARPFDKFFNWEEGGRKSFSPIVTVSEKVDGSLGILYRVGDEYGIATRGSFDSEQALVATQMLGNHDLGFLPSEYTLLFEIVYPENKIVVDYGDKRELVLLAARNRHTGEYVSREATDYIGLHAGFRRPKVYDVESVDGLLAAVAALDGQSEGFVVEFADGKRFKFKGERYRELHKILSGLSFNFVLNAIKTGVAEETRLALPDEFVGEFDNMASSIEAHVLDVLTDLKMAYAICDGQDRKEFAGKVTARYPELAPYLFAMKDAKSEQEIRDMILRREYK